MASSNRVSALPRILSCKRNSGLYKVEHGERPVIWRSSVSTRTIDYAAALEFYTANKLTMWEEEDQKEAAGKNDRKQ